MLDKILQVRNPRIVEALQFIKTLRVSKRLQVACDKGRVIVTNSTDEVIAATNQLSRWTGTHAIISSLRGARQRWGGETPA